VLPDDPERPYGEDRDAGVTPNYFRNPVHCVRVAKDGLVYICDRVNTRLQAFNKEEVGAECSNPDGEEGQCGFVGELFIRPDTLGPGSVWDLDTSSDRPQSCLHNADGTNQHIDDIERQGLKIVDTWGRNGRNASYFHWVHNVAPIRKAISTPPRWIPVSALRSSSATGLAVVSPEHPSEPALPTAPAPSRSHPS
jgi:hypothetical protein